MKKILTIKATPKNDFLLISQISGEITILDQNYDFKRNLTLNFDVEQIEILEDKDLIILGGEETRVYCLSDFLSGRIIEKFDFHQKFSFISYQFQRLITISQNGKIQQWDTSKYETSLVYHYDSFIYSLNQSETYLFIGGTKKFTMIDISNGKMKEQIKTEGDVYSISVKGEWILVGGSFFYLSLFYSNQLVAILPTSSYCFDSYFDSDQIITCGNEKYIYYWANDGKFKSRSDSNFKESYQLTKYNDDVIVFSNKILSIQKKNSSFKFWIRN